ncbi:MAG: hypothetical protein A2128_01200 [Candidatus Liptonbacteria bacterium GWC1_60_9]|uniref:Uncharacterized protein n=1 Tax=Candidatus Liptonbacteria bacterium GWC1_60_9 TaxID=1798645 RepID=A0A1G2C8N5_9BACT|nr:MAG: hypothetical protein A2128_01200 [Candidatus Liptonbacteria bacterium GWC1_60_9]
MQLSWKTYFFISIGILALFAIVLLVMGQPLICKCGFVKLWHGVVLSSENSQQLSDWYSFSHIIHGFAFYGLLWLVGRKWPLGLRLLLALGMEVSWEIFENTDLIINRYREATISLDYFGDSVINAVSDVLFMALGFFLAWRIPVWAAILSIIALEFFVGYSIRDNLLLNVIMLIYPSPAILQWQIGAGVPTVLPSLYNP